ncbi:unnamed protein product [Hymenolepis diminuta]|uniref:Zinc-hook domain-containing protein n=1 Tax=Hymenolepis diminuta TaxID=6216 RepID=A0A564YMY9_HYMDI|nr:unnamed protein product [Hymenolepis diminuta]
MRKIEESLISTCGSVNLDRSLDALMIKKKQLESDCATEEGSLHLWKKFRDRMAQESDCPLCHRGFSKEQDYVDLKEEIERRMVSIPRELDSKRRELQELIKQHEKIIELRPKNVEFSNLREVDIPKLEEGIKSLQSNLDELQSQIEKETSKLDDIQMKESVARKLQGDMAVIEKTEREIADMNRSLDTYKVSHSGSTQRPVAEMQEERRSLRAKCKDLSSEIEGLRTEMEQLLKQRQSAIDKEHELKNRHLKLEKEFQGVNTLNSEFKRLEAVKVRITGQLETSRGQLAGCQADLMSAEAEKQKISEQGEENVAFAMTEWQEWRDRSREFMEVSEAVASKYKNNAPPTEQLQKVERELASLEAKTEELKSKVVKTSEEVERIRTAINTHQIVQRELQDCVQLRKLQTQLGSLSIRIRDTQEKISACQLGISESTDVEEHVKKLSDQEERLCQRKQVISNAITRVKAELQMMEKDLREKYADAETEYLKKVYELKTSEMAATDLHHYYQALDRAILKHHEEKMNEINDIIRELWRTTYRGNDIDHIKICSEEEPLAAASRTRRTYNYRVVMVKAGSGGGAVATRVGKHARLTTSSETPLDMRGRCSAGQKVLASLVIRLALAEVFCLHCGVLALDEPTTNLDRENIESLAYALTEIIKTRSSQSNFQLIVITHDEDFIELLGRAGCANHLQRLVRNPEGLSEIQTVRMEDQFN